MGQHLQANPVVESEDESADQPTAWVGWIFFAGILMLLVGCFNVIAGVVALLKEDYFLVGPAGLMLGMDFTAWGWTYLIYGTVLTLAGFGIMVGQTWARVVAVVLAVVNALLNLTFLAAYPVWTMLIIVLDVIVVYALIVHGRETRSAA